MNECIHISMYLLQGPCAILDQEKWTANKIYA